MTPKTEINWNNPIIRAMETQRIRESMGLKQAPLELTHNQKKALRRKRRKTGSLRTS